MTHTVCGIHLGCAAGILAGLQTLESSAMRSLQAVATFMN